MTSDYWASRVAEVWDSADEIGDNILLERIDALVAERPNTDAEAAYEAMALLDLVEPNKELADAASAVRALVLVSAGRPVEGAGIALAALAPHLPRYQRSMINYAQELIDGEV